MLEFYCFTHLKTHISGGWRGKPFKNQDGKIEIHHFCLDWNEAHYPEFTTEAIKKERVEYANDQIQSHRQGEFSREFAEAHPIQTKKMLKAGTITKEQVKNAKYVWGNDIPHTTKKIDAEALIKD